MKDASPELLQAFTLFPEATPERLAELLTIFSVSARTDQEALEVCRFLAGEENIRAVAADVSAAERIAASASESVALVASRVTLLCRLSGIKPDPCTINTMRVLALLLEVGKE